MGVSFLVEILLEDIEDLCRSRQVGEEEWRDLKVKKEKDNHVFILFFFITIIFLLSKNFVAFFKIIKEYIVGDIFITYEDFPNIGEWLQIITSVLLSYLLLKATIKSNEINKRNIKLQERIVMQQEEMMRQQNKNRENEIIIKLSDLQRSIVFYYGEFNKNYTNLKINEKLGEEHYYYWLEQCVEVIKIHSNKIYSIIPEIKDIDNYINLRNKISAHEMDIQNNFIEKPISKELMNKLLEGLISSLKELNKVIVNEMKSL